VVDTEGREEVDDESVLRRSVAVVPAAGALVVVSRLVELVAIRFDRPF